MLKTPLLIKRINVITAIKHLKDSGRQAMAGAVVVLNRRERILTLSSDVRPDSVQIISSELTNVRYRF